VTASSVDVKAPLVFSCRSCKCIVGDTWNFVAASEEMNCITLDGPCSPVTQMSPPPGLPSRPCSSAPPALEPVSARPPTRLFGTCARVQL
jgi:hypothetical protein